MGIFPFLFNFTHSYQKGTPSLQVRETALFSVWRSD
jgi:hypothetical protein